MSAANRKKVHGSEWSFRTAYDHLKEKSLRVKLDTGTETHTQQHHKAECDINSILAKFAKTGELPSMIKREPIYGDFSEPTDYLEAMSLVAFANEQFASLSSKVRERFANDPRKFLEFAGDPENADEMARLGLMKPEAIERVKSARQRVRNEDEHSSPDKGESPAKGNPDAPKGASGAKPKARQDD